jgi:hypothetical protein
MGHENDPENDHENASENGRKNEPHSGLANSHVNGYKQLAAAAQASATGGKRG